jgi:hypothetical protein
LAVIGHEDVRAELAYGLDERPGGGLERLYGEAVPGEFLAVAGKAGVDEAEEALVDAEDLASTGHLPTTDPGQVGPDPGTVHRRVEDVAAFASGHGAHQDAGPLGGVPAMVAALLLDSSSGWACTAIRRRPVRARRAGDRMGSSGYRVSITSPGPGVMRSSLRAA